MESPGPGLSSLIVTLSENPRLHASALTSLAARSDLQLGEPGGSWVPAVLESPDPRAVFSEIESIPGVVLVEVVFVELSHPLTPSENLPDFAN
jgi:hypothetical protein